MKRRIVSILMALVMALSLLPVSVFAATTGDVTIAKTLVGKWDDESRRIVTADEYSPGDRVVYKLTATVKVSNVKSFTITDVIGENLTNGSFIAYTQTILLLDYNHVLIGAGTDKFFAGNQYSDTTLAGNGNIYDYSAANSVTVTHQKYWRTAAFTSGDTITVYYFATIGTVDSAGQEASNVAKVSVGGTVVNETQPVKTDITLKPYTVTFLDADGEVITGFDHTEYDYGTTIGTNVPADPKVADGSNGLLERFDGWYETTSGEKLDTTKAYNEDVIFKARVSKVMEVAKTLNTPADAAVEYHVGDEVSYTITVTVYDKSLESIKVKEIPGDGLINGKLTCNDAKFGVVYLGDYVRTAYVEITGNTATVTPILYDFASGDTITFTYTATLGIADGCILENSTGNKVKITNDKCETATITTDPIGKVLPPVIDMDVDKTVTAINGVPYEEGDTVSKGDKVTYEITVTNKSTVPVFGVPVIEKPSKNLTDGHFVPEEGTVTIRDLTKIDLSDVSEIFAQLIAGKSVLNVSLGRVTVVLTADWTKVDVNYLWDALNAIKNIEDPDTLGAALDILVTRLEISADSIEDVIGNVENYIAKLLAKYAFLDMTVYVDGKCADVAFIGRLDKNEVVKLTYEAKVNSCDKDGKVTNTVLVGCKSATEEIDALRYTVTYTDGVEDEVVFEDQEYKVLAGDTTPCFKGTPKREGYVFVGWEPEVAKTVTGDVTYVATWEVDIWSDEKDTDDEGDGIPDKYQVLINYVSANESMGTVDPAKEVVTLYAKNSASGEWERIDDATATGSLASAMGGYRFVYWTDEAGTKVSANATYQPSLADAVGGGTYTFTANFARLPIPSDKPNSPQLEKGTHFNYVMGYSDGTIRPNNEITRAEVAIIFFRLLTEESRNAYYSEHNDFTDVADTAKSNIAISTLTNAGILTGYSDGTFRPNAKVTRGQLAAIIARFADMKGSVDKTFTDIDGHWAKDLILLAASNGWIGGYSDGTFRPNRNITRAETMAIINRALDRQVSTVEDLLDGMNVWVDNMDPSAWYYFHVQEATNYHEYARKEGTLDETWTKKLPDIDWSVYQF